MHSLSFARRAALLPGRFRLAASLAMLAAVALAVGCPAGRAAETAWRAGAARVDITPGELMWMSGYGARDRPAEGQLTPLWAKALLLYDEAGNGLLLVSLDLVGIDRELALAVRQAVAARLGLPLPAIALCCSHTHSGPVVGRNLAAMYQLDESQRARVERYTARLAEQLVELAEAARSQLAPCRVQWGLGQATFAVNRRNNPESDVPHLRAAGRLRGPVDHDVPVLAVRADDGALRAVAFGYACHATVLDGYAWSGDYPGHAQQALEQRHPGAVALFWAGCGADQNPLPRRKVELAEFYGRELADAVDRALAAPLAGVEGSLAAVGSEIPLPFAGLPSRDEWQRAALSDNRFEASRARQMLARFEAGSPPEPTYPYPIATWALGDRLRLVLLGGEVVVDYALRLKHELGSERPGAFWVAGYSNDVMAYIPSRRVLGEGGYEGGGAMLYYGQPAPWGADVEERIVGEVRRQLEALAAPQPASR